MTGNGIPLPPLHPLHPLPLSLLPPSPHHQRPTTTANGTHHTPRGTALHFAFVPHTKTVTTSLPHPRHISQHTLFNTLYHHCHPFFSLIVHYYFLFFIQSHFTGHINRRGEGKNCTDGQTLARRQTQVGWRNNDIKINGLLFMLLRTYRQTSDHTMKHFKRSNSNLFCSIKVII